MSVRRRPHVCTTRASAADLFPSTHPSALTPAPRAGQPQSAEYVDGILQVRTRILVVPRGLALSSRTEHISLANLTVHFFHALDTRASSNLTRLAITLSARASASYASHPPSKLRCLSIPKLTTLSLTETSSPRPLSVHLCRRSALQRCRRGRQHPSSRAGTSQRAKRSKCGPKKSTVIASCCHWRTT
jgi:hypothetical protein